MKRVYMVLMMATAVMMVFVLSPDIASSYTNIEEFGELKDVYVEHNTNIRRAVVVLGTDGVLPKNEYIAEWDVLIDQPIKVESGTIIHFQYAYEWDLAFLWVQSSLTFEPGCTLDAINITDSATPVWGGIRVEESRSFEADGLSINNVAGDMIVSEGNLSLKNMSVNDVNHGAGKFFAYNSEITDIKFVGPAQVFAQNTTFNIGHGLETTGIHILFNGFNGKATLYDNNKWMGNGGNPLIKVDKGPEDPGEIISDPKKLAEHNILIQPPTAVLQRGWGEIKKLFQKH